MNDWKSGRFCRQARGWSLRWATTRFRSPFSAMGRYYMDMGRIGRCQGIKHLCKSWSPLKKSQWDERES